jgi:signal transduction histidine kinase
MSKLPIAISDRLASVLLDHHKVAYITADTAGIVQTWGGETASFGINNIEKGQPLQNCVLPLEGILDIDSEGSRTPLFLPQVGMPDGTSADIQVVFNEFGLTVLLIDRSEDVRREQMLQQAGNELSLLREQDTQHEKNSPGSLIDAVQDLEMVIFLRTGRDTFQHLGESPAWYSEMREAAGLKPDAPARPQELLAFLDSFLDEAHEHWDSERPGAIYSGLWQETTASGSELALQARAFSSGKDAYLMIAHVHADFSERQSLVQKAHEAALLHESLVSEVQKKEILLHSIVHDLNGPLASMLSAFELLAHESVQGDDRLELIEIGTRVARQQRALIREILEAFSADLSTADLSAIEAKDAPDGLECARNTVTMYRPSCETKGVELRFDHGPVPGDGWKIIGEESRLVRVLTNFLENALRHSPRESTIVVGVHDDGKGILFTVDDEGPGVPDELTGTLFNRFVKGKQKTGQAGMGLYSCRITVESWRGTIGTMPREGGGSRFWFRLRKPASH